MSIKVHHHSHTHFQEQLLKALVIQNNALWAIAEELNKMNDRPKDWSHIDKGVQ